MKILKLSTGQKTLLDDEDFNNVSKYVWRGGVRRNVCYARRHVQVNNKCKTIYLARFILNIVDPTVQVDHINGDTLDNRRSNLRICDQTQNIRNRGLFKNNTTGYKGVVKNSKSNTYKAQLQYCKNGKHMLLYLGSFYSKEEAAEAYNKEAEKRHLEFARLNKIKEVSMTDSKKKVTSKKKVSKKVAAKKKPITKKKAVTTTPVGA